jgi:hypothetical protein
LALLMSTRRQLAALTPPPPTRSRPMPTDASSRLPFVVVRFHPDAGGL